MLVRNGSLVVVLVLSALTSTGCGAGWRRTELADGTLKPRQQVQIWRAGEVARWHAVVVEVDTVSAVPFMQPVQCDSCRRRIPRAQIDSMRLGNPVAGFWKTVGLVVAIPIAIMLGVCIETGSWPNCFVYGGS
jgi:hypothetical protein